MVIYGEEKRLDDNSFKDDDDLRRRLFQDRRDRHSDAFERQSDDRQGLSYRHHNRSYSMGEMRMSGQRQQTDSYYRRKSAYSTSSGFKYNDNVTVFQGAGDILSNFYPCTIEFKGKTFRSSEHAYQYEKALVMGNEEVADMIFSSPAANKAKQISKQLGKDSRWDEAKIDAMRRVIRAKARCVREFYLAVLDAKEIIAEAVAGDRYWSAGLNKSVALTTPPEMWPGKNVMGQLLMELRKELLNQGRRNRSARSKNLIGKPSHSESRSSRIDGNSSHLHSENKIHEKSPEFIGKDKEVFDASARKDIFNTSVTKFDHKDRECNTKDRLSKKRKPDDVVESQSVKKLKVSVIEKDSCESFEVKVSHQVIHKCHLL